MRGRWWTARAVRLHVALGILLPACALLCNWQVHRALSGNGLSWAYVFEWPFFAAYGVYMWWRLLHEISVAPVGDGSVSAPLMPPVDEKHGDTAPDEELAAYNRYLADLHTSGHRKRW